MFCWLCFYCYPKNKFLLSQMKDEYNEIKLHISKLGCFTPHQVYYDDMLIINGLNSMCDLDIHISIGTNPTRIILSYVNNNNSTITKGQTFHIYKIIYKEIKTMSDINQYDIYNAIQDYIYTHKQFPINDSYIIAI